MDMATGKNKKGNARSGGSQASARHSGLETLESRVLFAAAPLVAELAGSKPADGGAAAIEVTLLPGEKLGADPGQTNGLVPTPPGEAENQVPGLVPTPEKHLTDHQPKGTHLNQFASKGHTHSIIDPDLMRPTDNPEGSNTTAHPMPVSALSDSVSNHRLEHGPGMDDEIWTNGTMSSLSEFPAKTSLDADGVDRNSTRSNHGTVALSDAGVNSSLSNTIYGHCKVHFTPDINRVLDLQDINDDGRIRVSEIITADLGFGYDTLGILYFDDDCHGCEECDVDGPIFLGGEPRDLSPAVQLAGTESGQEKESSTPKQNATQDPKQETPPNKGGSEKDTVDNLFFDERGLFERDLKVGGVSLENLLICWW